MSTANEKEKVFYSTTFGNIEKDGRIEDAILVFNGFANSVKARTVSTQSGEKKVVSIKVCAVFPDSKTKRLFGEQIVRSDHRVFFDVSFWGIYADTAEKIQEKSKIWVGCKGCKINTYTGTDGKEYTTVQATAFDFPHWDSSYKRTDDSGSENEPKPNDANASSAAQDNSFDDVSELEALFADSTVTDIDEECPF